MQTEVFPGRVKLLCEKLDSKLVGCDGPWFANHSIAFMRLTGLPEAKGEWNTFKLNKTEKETNASWQR